MAINFGNKTVSVSYNGCDPLEKNTYTLTLSGSAEVNGDHYCTIQFWKTGSRGIEWWYNDVIIEQSQGFLFTNAGETYELKARLTQGYAERDGAGEVLAPMNYTVTAIYAPAWANGYGTITPTPAITASCGAILNIAYRQCGTGGVMTMDDAALQTMTEYAVANSYITSISASIRNINTNAVRSAVFTAPTSSYSIRTCGLLGGTACSMTICTNLHRQIQPPTSAEVIDSATIAYNITGGGSGSISCYRQPTPGQARLTVKPSYYPYADAVLTSGGSGHPDGMVDTMNGISNSSGVSDGAEFFTPNVSVPYINVPQTFTTTAGPTLHPNIRGTVVLRADKSINPTLVTTNLYEVTLGGTHNLREFLGLTNVSFSISGYIRGRKHQSANSCVPTYDTAISVTITILSIGGVSTASDQWISGNSAFNLVYSTGGKYDSMGSIGVRIIWITAGGILSVRVRNSFAYSY